MVKMIASITALLVCVSLSGCNTARGFGADLEEFGAKLKTVGMKKQESEETVTTEAVPATYQVEEGAYSQPYQDPAYAPAGEAPTAITYPVEQGETYPEYK